MRVLLLSAYDADSHRSWWKGLQSAFDQWDWTILTLPARYFSWRIRGNSLTWAFQEKAVLEQDYDLLIATSMTDLSALRGFVPSIASIPTLVYFHENQFGYPNSDSAKVSVEPQILNIYTALCADRILFNTAFNRDSFLQGVGQLLRRLPDQIPSGVVDQLKARSSVLPVPIADACYSPVNVTAEDVAAMWQLDAIEYSATNTPSNRQYPVKLLWAARWEYDKGPELLLKILQQLSARGIDFKLCLLGQKFRRSPEAFAHIEQQFASQVVQFGYEASPARYRQWLSSADMIVSTALHEFQGLAVLEAMAAGCMPVLPDRLSYPELVNSDFLFDVSSANLAEQASAAVDLISALQTQPKEIDVADFSWSKLAPDYLKVFDSLASTSLPSR